MHIFKDGAYCGIDPIKEEEINFSIVCDKRKFTENKRPYEIINHYISQSEALTQMFNQLDQKSEVYSLFPISKKNKHIAGNAMAYVGDAAGFIDPLTGEGIYQAMYSALLLAKQIKKYPLEKALKKYAAAKRKFFFQKNLLNTVFQSIIRSPFLCGIIASYLKKNQEKANTFVGIIGNIYSPLQGLMKIFFQN